MRKILILWFFTICNLTSAQIIDFPDANFKNALVNTLCVDTNGNDIGDADADFNDDGEIDMSEAIAVKHLIVHNNSIQSLVGIEKFNNLKWLNCNYNQLAYLNVQDLVNLTSLRCENNQLTSLNVQGLANLKSLRCDYNQLTSLDVQGLINLVELYFSNNQLISIDLHGLTKLEFLVCWTNQLTYLNVNEQTNLVGLICFNNKFKYLEVEGLANLKFLGCSDNELTTLYVQGLTNLEYLHCVSNQLTTLFIKGTKLTESLFFENNPDLSYICCNEDRITEIKNMAIANNQNCEVDSECNVTNSQDQYTNINIYPNPVNDILYLDSNDHWTKAEIFDIAGRIMRSVNLHISSMDVSDLQSGTYFIRLKDGDKIGLVKFVKI